MRPMAPSSARISPTAHYTSYVWFKHGMSHPALSSRRGAVLHAALRPMNIAYERFGAHPSLDMMLLARHRVLDHLLAREIESGRVSQVIEVAAGLSPRGIRFMDRYRDRGLVYIEGDLPDMARTKRALLREAGLLGDGHRVATINALADDGDDSLEAVSRAHLSHRQGTAIITEGLLGYFDGANVRGMWRRFARTLRRFSHGVYFSDLNLAGDISGMRGAGAFRVLLSAFARGKVHLHFDKPAEVAAALQDAEFTRATVHVPGDFDDVDVPGRDRGHTVRLIEARTADAR